MRTRLLWLAAVFHLVTSPAQACRQTWAEGFRDVRTAREAVQLADELTRGRRTVTSLYVRTNAGGDGTDEATPAGSLATVAALVVGGGDFNVYVDTETPGQPLRAGAVFDAAGGTVSLLPWPGTSRWEARGGPIIARTEWTIHDGDGTFDVYKTDGTVPITAKPEMVFYNYRLDGQNHAMGVQPYQEGDPDTLANAVAILKTTPGWYWNSGNNRLYMSFPANDDPTQGHVTGKYVEYLPTGGDFLQIRNATGGSIESLDLHFPSDIDSWGIKGVGCQSYTIVDVTTQLSGFHAIGFNGSVCANNTIRRHYAYSSRVGNDSVDVFYSDNADVTGCLLDDCDWDYAPPLDDAGQPAEVGGIKGFASHTNGVPEIAGVEVRNCRSHWFGYNPTFASYDFVFSSDHAAPGDDDDPDTYPVRIVGGSYEGHGVNASGSAASYSTKRTVFTVDGDEVGAGQLNSETHFHVPGSGKVFHESTVMVGTIADRTNQAIMRTKAGAQVRLSNSAARVNGTYANAVGVVFAPSTTGRLRMTHSILDAENPDQVALIRSGITSSALTVSKCWYADFSTFVAANTSLDTRAEWEATIDADGRYAEDFTTQYADANTLRPTLDSNIATVRDLTANPDAPVGVNVAPYAGMVGPWQFGDNTAGDARSAARTRRLIIAGIAGDLLGVGD